MGRKAAEKLKIGAKIVDQYIREALKKGKVKAKEIIKYIEDKMAALSKVKCEDILDEDICKKVREVAAKVKVEMKKVEEVMKKIVAKGIVKPATQTDRGLNPSSSFSIGVASQCFRFKSK